MALFLGPNAGYTFLYVRKIHFLTFIVSFNFSLFFFLYFLFFMLILFHFYPNTDSHTIFVQLCFMLNGLKPGSRPQWEIKLAMFQCFNGTKVEINTHYTALFLISIRSFRFVFHLFYSLLLIFRSLIRCSSIAIRTRSTNLQ